MRKLTIHILYIAALAAIACSRTSNDASEDHASHEMHDQHHGHGDPRTTEVMAIHDSLMPRMGELMELSETIKVKIAQLDSLKKGAYRQDIEKGKSVAADLEIAGEGMMAWMHTFRADTLEVLTDAEGETYLLEQKRAIQSVKEKMETSILQARAYLN